MSTGTVSIVKAGGGTLVLSGSDNTYSGATIINAGTLQTGAEYALSPYSDVTVGDNGVLDMNGFDNQVNTLSGGGNVENSFAGSTVALAVGNTPPTALSPGC